VSTTEPAPVTTRAKIDRFAPQRRGAVSVGTRYVLAQTRRESFGDEDG
jgi:hypothetical protein